MSSPEVEKFEVTDYDLENEFNIDRPQRRQTKSQAIYGSFADSDEEDWEGIGRAGFGSGGGKKNYTSNISFVSGGFKKTAKDEAAEVEETAEGLEEDPLLQEQFGMKKKPSKPQRSGLRSVGRGMTPKSFADWEKHTKSVASSLMLKMGYKPGKGLGKNEQGIAAPVEAKQRLGKGALGYYGSERTDQSLKDFPVKDEDAEEEKKFKEQLSQWKRTETGAKRPQYVYKTADELIAKGVKRKTKDIAQLPKVKVIDMTGKEQRVLSGYHAIANKMHDLDDEQVMVSATGEKRAFEMPELLHNLNMLIDLSEEEIITRDRQLRYERDMAVNMQHEHERLEVLCQQEEEQLSRLSQVLAMIETIEERTQVYHPNPLRLEECADLFQKLQENFYEEYMGYDLVTLSIAVVFPLMKKYFSGWQPLSDPSFGTDVMKQWKALLDFDRQHGESTAHHNAYAKLIWDVWMPFLRAAISQWNSRNPDALIEVLEAWLPLLPPWTLQNILIQLIHPKLQMEVDNWNPLTDTVPIHAWLHPWLPLMGSRLEPLWAPIRHKLANALSKWHPSDVSAKLMLKPWVSVFSPGHMDAFLVKNIVPKLAMCLQEFVINPANQSMDGWKWVMSWQDLLSDQTMIGLLDRCFFPRWLQVLTSWLNSNPNYEEVSIWYKGWKGMLPERLLNHLTVKENFSKALALMNRAVTGVPQVPPLPAQSASYPIAPLLPPHIPGVYGTSSPLLGDYGSARLTPPPPPPLLSSGPMYRKPEKNKDEKIAPPLSTSVPHSFKDLVAMKAAENNLEFYPLVGKTYEARQIYQCGRVQITIDRGVIFSHEGSNVVPLSLKELLMKAVD